MRGTSHAIIGITLAGVIINITGQSFGIAGAAAAGLGSLLPDIDEDTSTINKYMPLHYKKLIYAVLGGYLIYQMIKTRDYTLLIPAVLSLLIYFSKHRGFTHSLLAAVILSLSYRSNLTYLYPFITGYVLHLICDMMNEKGIKLLYPMKKMFKFPIHFTMDSMPGIALEFGLVVVSSYMYFNQIGLI